MKTLIFDLGGVCLSNHWSKEQRKLFSKQFDLDLNKLEENHRKYLKDLVLGKISEEDYFIRLFSMQEKSVDIKQAVEFTRTTNYSFPEVLGLIDKLSKKYDTYAFTNEIREAAEFRIKRFNLNAYFKKIFVSSEIGFEKFDKESFLYIAECIKKQPEDIIFIDDSPDFIKKASSIGMQTILFEDINKLKKSLEKLLITP